MYVYDRFIFTIKFKEMQMLKQQIDDAKQTVTNQKQQMTAIETDRNGIDRFTLT